MPNTVAELSIVAEVAAPQTSPEEILGSVRHVVDRELIPLVQSIDADGLYPEPIMKALGAAGAYRLHVPGIPSGAPDLWNAIQAMSIAGEHCLSTSFCMWCQDALAWYIFTSANEELKHKIGTKVAAGQVLGGTGLSNPMKTIFGIERMRLKGRRVEGGYEVKGLLPWVSNLGEGHFFGAMFETDDEPAKRVMAVVDCSGPGVKITQNDDFVALDGTRTYAVQLRDAFIGDDMILADPIDGYLQRIRCGFILMQAGMAFGIIRGCIKLMHQARASLSHVNCYLDKQPEDFEAELAELEATVRQLCATPFSTDQAYFKRVIEARLAAGEASVAAAHFAMLHQGARGYVAKGAAQRRLREAYFVAIVTPATKQLKKMLADMSA